MTKLSTMGTIFAVIILAFSLVCLGFFIALAIYFDRARNFAESNPSAPISAGTASLMMWFSIIMAVFATGLLIYGIVYLVKQSAAAKKLDKLKTQYKISASISSGQDNNGSGTATDALNVSNFDNGNCSAIVGNNALQQACVNKTKNTTTPQNPQASTQGSDRLSSMAEQSSLGSRIPRSSYYGY